MSELDLHYPISIPAMSLDPSVRLCHNTTTAHTE